MYTEEQLTRYAYFQDELAATRLDLMLDPLTGLLARPYIIGFAQWLIAQGTPFSYAILDLDNFKFINDTYGHHAGDGVLESVAQALAGCLEGIGLAGRFGGDELLIVNLRDIAYDQKKEFFKDLYANGRVLRRNVLLEDCQPFITGTVGCATYPDDAADYDGLFALIDKTLYRGKTKGRNCYIIYVEEKHKDIEIRQLARHGVCTAMHRLVRQFELVPGLMNKLQSVLPLLMEELQISDLYYAGRSGVARGVRNRQTKLDVRDIGKLMNDDVYSTSMIDKIQKKSPLFYASIQQHRMETVLIARVGMDMETDGYLICAESRSHRIWQEDESAIIYFLAKLLAASIRIGGERLGE